MRTAFVSLAAAFVAAPGVPQAPNASPVQAAIAARYIALRTAIDAKDQATMRAVLAPDFVNVDVFGARTDADGFVGEAVDGDPPPPGNRRTSTVTSVVGGGPIVTAIERYESNSPYPTAYGPHYRRSVSLSKDLWRLSGGSWRLLRSDTQELWIWCDAVLVDDLLPPTTPGGGRRKVGGTGQDCIDQEPKALR